MPQLLLRKCVVLHCVAGEFRSTSLLGSAKKTFTNEWILKGKLGRLLMFDFEATRIPVALVAELHAGTKFMANPRDTGAMKTLVPVVIMMICSRSKRTLTIFTKDVIIFRSFCGRRRANPPVQLWLPTKVLLLPLITIVADYPPTEEVVETDLLHCVSGVKLVAPVKTNEEDTTIIVETNPDQAPH